MTCSMHAPNTMENQADNESVIDMDETASGPRVLRVTVVSIQHLPKMDSSFMGGKCDPYIVLELKGNKFTTQVLLVFVGMFWK
jgi:hypothetical protein